MEAAVGFHFVDFNVRKESPHYIIFWDNANSRLSWNTQFLKEEFYNNFEDIRLYVGIPSENFERRVGLICIFCAAVNRPVIDLMTEETTSPIAIHKMWNDPHINHHGLPAAFNEGFLDGVSLADPLFLLTQVQIRFNLSSSSKNLYIDDHMRHYVSLYRYFGLASQAMLNWMLYGVSPRYKIIQRAMRFVPMQLLTVVHKRLFKRNGWLSIFLPVQPNTWSVLFVMMLHVAIFCVLWGGLSRNISCDRTPDRSFA